MKAMPLLIFVISIIISPWIHAQYTQVDFKKLHRLKGTWTMNTSKGILNESWEIMNDSLLMGKSYEVQGKDTIPQEIVRLEFKEGNITYNPVVVDQNQQKPVVFKLASIRGNEFIFENKMHDFPQQIVYNLGVDGLLASVSGATPNGIKEIKYK